MSTMRLNIRFHNRNSAENTHKIVSEVFSDICVKKIRSTINDTPTEKISSDIKPSGNEKTA